MAWWSCRKNPNPISGLTKSDVKTIQKTWGTIYKSPDAYGLELFKRFFRTEPATKKLFKAISNLDENQFRECTQFRMHVYSFMTAFNMAISKLNEPELIVPMMERLGKSHKKHGVPQQYFMVLQDVFVDFLQNDLKLKQGQIESWARFMGFIYPIIFDALTQA